MYSHTEFSLSAYKRNKRKMELAEKMDTGHNQTKKRRQSSENVSTMISVKIRTIILMASSVFFLDCIPWVRMDPPFPADFVLVSLTANVLFFLPPTDAISGWNLTIWPGASFVLNRAAYGPSLAFHQIFGPLNRNLKDHKVILCLHVVLKLGLINSTKKKATWNEIVCWEETKGIKCLNFWHIKSD